MNYNYQQLLNPYSGQLDTSCILRLPDHTYIPNDPDNTDWQAYQEWLAQGNTPLPPA